MQFTDFFFLDLSSPGTKTTCEFYDHCIARKPFLWLKDQKFNIDIKNMNKCGIFRQLFVRHFKLFLFNLFLNQVIILLAFRSNRPGEVYRRMIYAQSLVNGFSFVSFLWYTRIPRHRDAR